MNERLSRHLNRENSLSGRSGEGSVETAKIKQNWVFTNSTRKRNSTKKSKTKKLIMVGRLDVSYGSLFWLYTFLIVVVVLLFFLSNSQSKTKQQQLMRHILCMCLCMNNKTLLAYETHFFLSRFVDWFHFWYFGCVKTKTLDILYGSEEAQFKSMSMSHKNVWI